MTDTAITITDKRQFTGQLTPVGYIAPKDITEKEWGFDGEVLGMGYRTLKWAIGDWIEVGAAKWGEKYTQAVDETGINPDRLANYSWVARSVPYSLRNEKLSWWHHYLVAGYEQEYQTRLLAMAARHDWPTRKFSRAINLWRLFVEGPPEIPASRQSESYSFTLPALPMLKDDVLDHYPTASEHQSRDMARFVLDTMKKYAAEPGLLASDNHSDVGMKKAWWKKMARRYRRMYESWYTRAAKAEDELEEMRQENRQQFAEIVSLQKMVDILESGPSEVHKLMENY